MPTRISSASRKALARRVPLPAVDDDRPHVELAREARERHRDLPRADDDERRRRREPIEEDAARAVGVVIVASRDRSAQHVTATSRPRHRAPRRPAIPWTSVFVERQRAAAPSIGVATTMARSPPVRRAPPRTPRRSDRRRRRARCARPAPRRCRRRSARSPTLRRRRARCRAARRAAAAISASPASIDLRVHAAADRHAAEQLAARADEHLGADLLRRAARWRDTSVACTTCGSSLQLRASIRKSDMSECGERRCDLQRSAQVCSSSVERVQPAMPDFARPACVRLDQATASSTSDRPRPRSRRGQGTGRGRRRATRLGVPRASVRMCSLKRSSISSGSEPESSYTPGIFPVPIGRVVDGRRKRASRSGTGRRSVSSKKIVRLGDVGGDLVEQRRRARLPYALRRSFPPIVSVTQHRLVGSSRCGSCSPNTSPIVAPSVARFSKIDAADDATTDRCRRPRASARRRSGRAATRRRAARLVRLTDRARARRRRRSRPRRAPDRDRSTSSRRARCSATDMNIESTCHA